MDLSIIIVNWNSTDYLRKCLASLFRQRIERSSEVIVIDNASYDGCGAMLDQEFPEINFIQSDENLGFANANNLGFTHSSGAVALFLNPDTEILDASLDKMYRYLTSNPLAGAVGCKLLNADHSVQSASIQAFPTIANQILGIEHLRRRFPRLKLWGIESLWSNDGTTAEVDVVSGACLMVKREIFEQAGCFSPEYFMYSEDVDLCYKIKNLGYQIFCVTSAAILHHSGSSSAKKGDRFFQEIMIKESRSIFFRKSKGRCYSQLYRILMSLASLIRLAILFFLVRPRKLPRDRYHDYSMQKWLKTFRWSLGLEKWAARSSACTK